MEYFRFTLLASQSFACTCLCNQLLSSPKQSSLLVALSTCVCFAESFYAMFVDYVHLLVCCLTVMSTPISTSMQTNLSCALANAVTYQGRDHVIWINDVYETMWHSVFNAVKNLHRAVAAVVTYAPPGWSKSARAQAAARIERQLASFASYICEDPTKLPPIYIMPEPVAAAVAACRHLETDEPVRVMMLDVGEQLILRAALPYIIYKCACFMHARVRL